MLNNDQESIGILLCVIQLGLYHTCLLMLQGPAVSMILLCLLASVHEANEASLQSSCCLQAVQGMFLPHLSQALLPVWDVEQG